MQFVKFINLTFDHIINFDSHNDFPTNLREIVFNDLRKVNFSDDLTQVEPWASSRYSYTDLPRLRKGKVGGQVRIRKKNL